jgi:nucleotide-binding universal stress UspA family protein
LQCRAIAVHGDAASRILEQEEDQGAALIVFGKHGAGMTEELLLGGVTKHVLAHSRGDVPVAHR